MIADQPVEGVPTRRVDVPIAVQSEHQSGQRPVRSLDFGSDVQTAEVVDPTGATKHVAWHALPFTSAAFLTALALLISQGVAIDLATKGSLAAATTIAELLVWLTVIPFVLAVIALVRGPHRGWAIAAMIVSVIANPLILRFVLSFFGSLS